MYEYYDYKIGDCKNVNGTDYTIIADLATEIDDRYAIDFVASIYLRLKYNQDVKFERFYNDDECDVLYRCSSDFQHLFNADAEGIFVDYDIWDYLSVEAKESGYTVNCSNGDDDLIEQFGEEAGILISGKEHEGIWLSLITFLKLI